mmetsp:Transcript_37475/g.77728  ORF Transcript_37475/g.77728 Transcript_37475/m.77728 type:complete len:393 (-) Transcript_37475:72-1250(-)
MRNFMDLWRMTAPQGDGSGIVTFAPMEEFKSTFWQKGIQVLLCESLAGERSTHHYWLEYVDRQLAPQYVSPYDVSWGANASPTTTTTATPGQPQTYQRVAGGRHVVPPGVVVEELGEFSKFTDDCPAHVQKLLVEKGLWEAYLDFVEALSQSNSTRGFTDNWKGTQILKVMEDFVDVFAAKNIQLVLCKLKPDKGRSYRWFEFIDTTVATQYVPQYDMTNDDNDEELETAHMTLKFPKGVAVEPLTDRKALVEQIPTSVRTLLEKKDCYELYITLVDVLCESGSLNVNQEGFSEYQVGRIAQSLGPQFAAKGVGVFFSAKTETDLQGQEETTIYWLEFVDRDLQPNYLAQRGIDVQKFPSEGISAEEIKELAIAAATTIAIIAVQIAMGGEE